MLDVGCSLVCLIREIREIRGKSLLLAGLRWSEGTCPAGLSGLYYVHAVALSSRHTAVLFQPGGRGVAARTGARTKSRTLESLRRKAASAGGRIALCLRVP